MNMLSTDKKIGLEAQGKMGNMDWRYPQILESNYHNVTIFLA
jgi:hypothetical protein